MLFLPLKRMAGSGLGTTRRPSFPSRARRGGASVADAPVLCRVPPAMRLRRSLTGLFLALLALMCQVAVGATVPAAAAQALRPLAGFGVICHAEDGGPAPAHRHSAPDCQLCPLCVAFVTPAATLADAPAVPAPVSVALPLAAPPPPATAPPVPRPLETRPRGPPALS